jgi:hypothetical protein
MEREPPWDRDLGETFPLDRRRLLLLVCPRCRAGGSPCPSPVRISPETLLGELRPG